MRPHCLLAYDATGAVVATLDYLVARDDAGAVIGLVDFAAHEANGGEHTDVWQVGNATGSKVWPEWLGAQAHQFRVELAGPSGAKWISALVHKQSGHRRERAAIEAAIAAAPLVPDGAHAVGGARDIRHIVGGPGKPLVLRDDGTTSDAKPSGTPAHLPILGRSPA